MFWCEPLFCLRKLCLLQDLVSDRFEEGESKTFQCIFLFFITLSDGVSTIHPEDTIPFAEAAHADGIHIYTIGVGLTDTRELDGIATAPASENSFSVPDFDALQEVDDRIFAQACPRKILFFTFDFLLNTIVKSFSFARRKLICLKILPTVRCLKII